MLDLKDRRVFVAGHQGMVGSAIIRRLESENCAVLVADRRDLDLTQQRATEEFVLQNQPDVVVIAAAKVGGIVANSAFPVDFLADNLAIACNLINASYKARVRKLLFLGWQLVVSAALRSA
jgi:GDP-L-fucose synthase